MNAIGKLGGDVWKNLENPVGKNVAEEIPVLGQELWNIFDKKITPPATGTWKKLAEEIPSPRYRDKTQGDIWAGN